MKNRVLYSFTMFLAVGIIAGACSRKGYMVKGKIDGEDVEGKAVYLYSGVGPFFTKDQIVDSALITGGKFEISGKQAHPDVYTLKFYEDYLSELEQSDRNNSHHLIPVFLGDGTVTVEAEYDQIPFEEYIMMFDYDYSPINVTGPSDFEIFLDYARGKHDALASEIAMRDEYTDVYSSKDIKVRSDYVDRAIEASKIVKAYVTDFVRHNSGNSVGLWALHDNLTRLNHDEIESLSAGFSERMKASPLGVKILTEAAEYAKCSVGASFHDFALQDPDGKTVMLSDHLGKGRYVLLEFWSSTCGPCRFDIPHLKEVYKLFHPDGFDIISISMDTDHSMWINTLRDSSMPWMQLSELKGFDGEISKLYNFIALPTSILVGPDGKIINRKFRGAFLDKGLIDIFGNKFVKR